MGWTSELTGFDVLIESLASLSGRVKDCRASGAPNPPDTSFYAARLAYLIEEAQLTKEYTSGTG
jgi:hypothetical protein